MPKKLKKEKNSGITIDMVQNIIDYMEENLLNDLSPKMIAARFYLSISAMNHLLRLFAI